MEIIKTFESFQEYRKSDLIKETDKIEEPIVEEPIVEECEVDLEEDAMEAEKEVESEKEESDKDDVSEDVVNEGLGSMIDKVKKYFSTKFEAFIEKNPELKESFEKVKEAAAELTDDDKQKLSSANPMDLAKVTESINGELVVEGLGDKIQAWLGLSVSGTAFVGAVSLMIKAAVGAGFFTFGLPIGTLVAVAMGVFAVSGWVGQSGHAKAYPATAKAKSKKRAVSSQGRVDDKGRRR